MGNQSLIDGHKPAATNGHGLIMRNAVPAEQHVEQQIVKDWPASTQSGGDGYRQWWDTATGRPPTLTEQSPCP
jgi:hypothetical protein